MTPPRSAWAGVALGAFGGILCIVAMAFLFKPETDAVPDIGSYMLLAALFFAIAGAFTANNQWSWDMLLFVTFLTAAVSMVLTIMGAIDIYGGILIFVIAAAIVAVLLIPSSKTWLDRPKL
ncbi:MAG: hypothetical protein LBT41_00930 [Candidatus Methanoplasma sp.]|jgi:hypothetical membrane protein|nr:hypothetical protein [Candidatus Methanoplasma sp.]